MYMLVAASTLRNMTRAWLVQDSLNPGFTEAALDRCSLLHRGIDLQRAASPPPGHGWWCRCRCSEAWFIWRNLIWPPVPSQTYDCNTGVCGICSARVLFLLLCRQDHATLSPFGHVFRRCRHHCYPIALRWPASATKYLSYWNMLAVARVCARLVTP